MVSKEKKRLMIFQKEILGWLGFGLVPSALLGGLLGDNSELVDPKWWYSISMTYYANSRICMIGVLFSMALLLFSYVPYQKSDKILSKIASFSALGILVFPCKHSGITTTGLLGLDCNTSFIIHCICASVMFICFAIMVGIEFRKKNPYEKMTHEKEVRNKIYAICAIVIVVFLIVQAITSQFDKLQFFTIINETMMLWAFSFAWLVKAEFFSCFNDKTVSPEISNYAS